jgi:ketosteroid isomerase-like protein
MSTNPEDRVRRVRSLLAALNDHDVAATVEHHSAKVIRNRGDGTSLQGREALAAYLRTVFAVYPDASVIPTNILAVEPKFVLLEWVMHATLPTGRIVHTVGADLFGFNTAGEIELDEARIDTAMLQAEISSPPRPPPAEAQIRLLAERYTAAWRSRDAGRVADYYASNGSLRVNGAEPAVGRGAITEVAQGFLTAFPDMRVLMDGLLVQGDCAVYRWTLEGTNTGPGGTGHRVCISGFEVWRIGDDGLIAESRGYFDSEAYQRQLENGVESIEP